MINQNLNIDPSDVAKENCEWCEGMGITFHQIGVDDFDVEICTCIPDDVDISELVMGC
ncbi:hypothetical protein UFOVP1491_44 [uncultured Caudovirales phage]|uniref:Uncharacterized protein n=1 Tax=uncultured Caudovirales phage TaxID=2100421 RepID=A0A6J7XJR1_9CAUD|nr:hypothetical protein UFOVP485_77 [uncultured Caudovirales phage]CAB4150795.1 hypothetical protein UFOVP575_29 [uncultured Caudovirales phage]CAB4175201.1 hypothetical protein UFOVP963_131 [uncultured Caudovirales phage]CAB4179666.1 hypothetical protein UFOVP1032_44 [uncultured Caudovirales phage]CAB4185792.1 hypothetical protein UFOVP1125_112 [uncultured Caudovirales phage]